MINVNCNGCVHIIKCEFRTQKNKCKDYKLCLSCGKPFKTKSNKSLYCKAVDCKYFKRQKWRMTELKKRGKI